MDKELQEKMKSILYFVIKMLLFSIPLYIIIWTGWESLTYQNFITHQIKRILNLLGIVTMGSGNYFTTNGLQFLISWDCTGWKSILFFIALIISTPTKFTKKIIGIIVGLYGLFVTNILRIVILIELAILYGKDFFLFAHDILWQLFGITIVLVFWISWIYLEKISFHPTD
ncbi:MAG: archaeosortase/exosortase family protein [Candidatus Aenigmatarchaeota archaeon]